MHVVHVLRGGADIFGGDVSAAQALDEASVCAEDPLAVLGLVVADDDRLPAAEPKSCYRILVGHSTRQPQRVDDRFFVGRVRPEPRASERWAEARAVDGNDAAVAARRIAAQNDL